MRWLPIVLVLLAGCTSPETAPYASFEAAMAAPGDEHVVGDWTFKVLEPRDHAHTGIHEVYVFLYDTATQAPVQDAGIVLDATLPSRDVRADNEADPAHVGHGVYKGLTDLFMPGEWQMRFTFDLPEAPVVDQPITVEAADGAHEHGPGGHTHG